MEFNNDIAISTQFNIIDYFILTLESGARVDYQDGKLTIILEDNITAIKHRLRDKVINTYHLCNINTIKGYLDTSIILRQAATGLTLIRENTPFSFINGEAFKTAFQTMIGYCKSMHTLNQMVKLMSFLYINCLVFQNFSKGRDRICQELKLSIKAFGKYMKFFENIHLFYVSRASSVLEGVTRAYGVNDNFIPKGLRQHLKK